MSFARWWYRGIGPPTALSSAAVILTPMSRDGREYGAFSTLRSSFKHAEYKIHGAAVARYICAQELGAQNIRRTRQTAATTWHSDKTPTSWPAFAVRGLPTRWLT